MLEDKDAPKADAVAEEASLDEELLKSIGILNERELAVISRYYGIQTTHQTMIEIAMELGLTRERVRQIRHQAVRKLRKKSKKEKE